MLSEDILQGPGIEQCVIWDLVDDVGQVCEEVALVLVCEDSGHACVVELYVFVMYADKVDGGVLGDEGRESV